MELVEGEDLSILIARHGHPEAESVSSGERKQVSTGGGFGAVWRADSRELFFETRGSLMAVTTSERAGSLETGPPQRLFDIQTQGLVSNQAHNVEVAANGQKFLVNSIVGGSGNVPLEVTINWKTTLGKVR